MKDFRLLREKGRWIGLSLTAAQVKRQVLVMFSIARFGASTVKSLLTKLWPYRPAGRHVENGVQALQHEPKYIRNDPEEGATRTVHLSGRNRPVKRQPEQGRMKSISSSSVSSKVSETRMADVIRLQDRQPRGIRRMAVEAARHDATILLFTGIRYERMESVTLPKAPVVAPVNGTQKH